VSDSKLCPACNNVLIQKNRATLFFTGIALLIISVAIFIFLIALWPAAALLILIAGYLIIWSTAGRGLWCRQCKKFFSSHKHDDEEK
jgi:hypothetical protein